MAVLTRADSKTKKYSTIIRAAMLLVVTGLIVMQLYTSSPYAHPNIQQLLLGGDTPTPFHQLSSAPALSTNKKSNSNLEGVMPFSSSTSSQVKKIIKMTHGTSSSTDTNNDKATWKLVDWNNPFSPGEEEKFSCVETTFQSAQTGKEAQMCVHDRPDAVSGAIKASKRFHHCNILSEIWTANNNDDDSVYLEFGANIGSCVMEMLLGTNATIIAFEPHPMNAFNIKKSVSKLDQHSQDRLFLFPIGLGDERAMSTIYAANGNMGNSNIGKIVKDRPSQQFDEQLQFTIHVERLDAILETKNMDRVKLVKMDVQGYECRLLKGMGTDIAEKIDVLKLEYAPKWLRGQGCMDLTPTLKKLGFGIYRNRANGVFAGKTDQDSFGFTELFAVRERN